MGALIDELGAALRRVGVRRVFGSTPVGDLVHVPADDATARLLADADGAVGEGLGCSLTVDGRLRLSSRPGAVCSAAPDGSSSWAGWVADVAARDRVGPVAAELAVGDLSRVVAPPDPDLFGARSLLHVELELPGVGSGPVVVLAGPGVVRSGADAVDGLRRLAATAGVGVVNTWGAKGLFEWQSPHHLGTAGLQARDFELAGLAAAGLIVAVGVDEAESPRYRWQLGPVAEAEPWRLGDMADRWPRPSPPTIERPPLYTELAEVVLPMFGDDPPSPGAAIRELKERVPAGGLVAADPGPAGFWVARCFPTTELGSVVVPATVAAGFAAAAALVAGLDGRPAVAVTTAPVDPVTEHVVEVAGSLGVAVDLEVWGSARHPVDFSRLAELEAVAGGVVAWA